MQKMARARILSASAGSGKTYQLAYKYVHDVIERPDLYRGILAVTFTNKATEEMKSRILKEIHILASGEESSYMSDLVNELQLTENEIRNRAIQARSYILHDYSRFSVLTIDRFFQRILRAFIKELGLELNYNLELDVKLLISRGVDEMIEQIQRPENSELKEWLIESAEARLSVGEGWDIRSDINSLGKSYFANRTQSNLKMSISKDDLRSILSDISRRVDGVKSRLSELGCAGVKIIESRNLDITQFNGGARGVANCFHKYTNGDFIKPTDTMYATAEGSKKWFTAKANPDAIYQQAADDMHVILNEICDLYDANTQLISTDALLRKNYHTYALLGDMHSAIEELCKAENLLILDDTKHILSTFVNDNNAPFIYEKVGNRYERYMIDEFQDTSTREWLNMLPLLHNAMASSEETSVFIVGDVKQSIYRWRGGDWQLLGGKARQALGESSTETTSLEYNYRSLPNIVDFNNQLIGRVVEIGNYNLNTAILEAASAGYIDDVQVGALTDILKNAYTNHAQKVGKRGDKGGYAEIGMLDDVNADAAVIQTIEDAISRGYRYRDILILVRKAKHGRLVADALLDYKRRRFTDNGEQGFNILTNDVLTVDSCDIVHFIIAILRLTVNINNDIERAIYNGYLGKDYDAQFSEDEVALITRISHLLPMEAFELIVSHYKLYERVDDIAYLQALHEQMVSISTSRIADIHQYLDWWDEQGHKGVLQVNMDDNTIEIMTIHKAKGLERPVVIIPYCDWDTNARHGQNLVWSNTECCKENSTEEIKRVGDIGKYPIVYGDSMRSSAFSSDYYNEFVMNYVDAINMLYVAVTRASEELYIFTPTPKKRSNTSIKHIIKIAAEQVCAEQVPYTEFGGMRYSFGEKIKQASHRANKGNEELLNNYYSGEPQLSIHYPTKRYTEENISVGVSVTDYGIHLHKVLEKAISESDLFNALNMLDKGCVIDSVEAAHIRTIIEQSLQNTTIKEWFSDVWTDVKTEVGIIANGSTRRPDRVMINGKRAVVLDYKFGKKHDIKHKQQVATYMTLLKEMGYTSIEGYVWYVSLGDVVSVDMSVDASSKR